MSLVFAMRGQSYSTMMPDVCLQSVAYKLILNNMSSTPKEIYFLLGFVSTLCLLYLICLFYEPKKVDVQCSFSNDRGGEYCVVYGSTLFEDLLKDLQD